MRNQLGGVHDREDGARPGVVLLREYHPDLHHQTPQKAKAATELTMQVTQAYNELDVYLNRKG